MNKEDFYTLGHVSKSFGIKGELIFFLDVDNPQKYKQLESVFIEINMQLVPFFISRIQVKKDTAIVQLEGVDSLEKAEDLVKAELFLPLKSLPVLKGKDFYFHEILGFKVLDKNYGDIGLVDKILDYPQQKIFQIKKNFKEILIPIKKDFIIKVDRENKILEINAPPGLIDVYLDDSKDDSETDFDLGTEIDS